MKRLDEIEARASEATGGAWGVSGTDFANPLMGITAVVADRKHSTGYDCEVIAVGGLTIPDAEFIAHARADVPALVAAIRAVIDLSESVQYGDEVDPLVWGSDIRKRITSALEGDKP